MAIERETRPELTIETLIDEIVTREDCRQLTLPQPEEWQVKGVTSTYHAYSHVSVKVCIDGKDIRFEATVITDAFPLESAWDRKNYAVTHRSTGTNR